MIHMLNPTETILTPEERLSWFHEARLGLFIHWGPYSVAGRGEWVMNRERISKQEYQNWFVSTWKAEAYDPIQWVELAKASGAGYVVLTARHHDGFCLWDTKTTDWNSVEMGPKQDLVASFVEAARKADLKVGLYMSAADWTHPDYPGAFHRDWPSEEDWESDEARKRFVRFYQEQTRELMTNYGTIDLLWWDGCFPGCLEGADTNRMVRELQPNILINERNGEGFDFRISEQIVRSKPGAWEASLTLNRNWGWHAGDAKWKTSDDVIMYLLDAAGEAGNLLINIGPRGDGSIPEKGVDILRDAGEWISRNRESISNSERHEFSWNNSCKITVKDQTVYLHFHSDPGSRFCWAELSNRVRSARLLSTGESIPFTQEGHRIWLDFPFEHLPDHPITTVALEVEGTPAPTSSRTTFWIPE